MKQCIKIVLLVLSSTIGSSLRIQNFNSQWTARAGEAIGVPNATVPGGVFSDLMNNDLIDDIFYGTGDSNYSWVGSFDWDYTTTFAVDEELLAYRVVSLVFEGLDTFATISINGEEIGTTENMFVRYVFYIKDQLKLGDNEISVQFTSAVTRAKALAEDPNNEYRIPPECPAPEYKGICHVNRIRKMQASFSWDWGPAFASVGIWKDVYLQAFDNAVVDYVLATPTLNETGDVWTLEIATYINGGTLGPISGALNYALDLGNGTKIVQTEQYKQTQDLQIIATTWMNVPIEGVNTWWPNGYGSQDLYNLTVSFVGDTESSEKTVRVGFRTIELVQDELEQGLSFYFKINGYPIFAMGANEIPINILPEKGQDPDVIRKLLQTAKDTNMNMLRVWGGGVYESDYFYDLADEYGILIWQDFMFACALYPTDDAYLTNVVAEIQHQVKRLASHPSIAIWSGNNENEGALSDDWYNTTDNFDAYKSDYIQLYVNVIQNEVLGVLPSAIFVTSSPSNGLQTVVEEYVADWPGNPLYGDVHFYDYTSDSWNVSTFPTPRFASEYGYQSMPNVESWLTATDNSENLRPESDFLINRQHHPDGNQQNVDLINQQLQLPDPSSENYAEAFIYFSQIIQAQAVKVQTEHYRSFKGRLDEQGQGNTMGALYWQLNDVWVAPTWSGMDYTGRWKILQYFTQDFFNSMIVTGRLSNDDNLEVYAVLDALAVPDVSVKAVVHVYSWDSLVPLIAVEFPVTLDPLASVLVTTLSASTTLSTAGCGTNYTEAITNCFFHLHLMDQDNNHLVPFNHVFPGKLKDSNLANANLEISSVTAADEDGKVFEIVVTTDVVALYVWLDSHDIRGRFSENGFLHVLPSKTVYFTAEEATTLDDFTAALTITHLRDPAYL